MADAGVDGGTVEPARTAAGIAEAARLFRAYAATLPMDLGYQNFETELATLPGPYAAPEGALLLARAGGRAGGRAVGCVAMRPLGDGACEMKRLYVAPEGRGLGLGRALATAVIAAAERAGHREMRLDTLPSLTAALVLYRSLGFVETAAYYDTPIADTVFFSLRLGRARP